MKKQIEELLAYYQLTAAEFAKIIGVNPSGLSHILGGKRNFLSIDTIIKIKAKYPDVRLDWLVLGDGGMIDGNTEIQSLFDANETENSISHDDIKAPENQISENIFKDGVEYRNLETLTEQNKVSKIIIYNSDNSFVEFVPKM